MTREELEEKVKELEEKVKKMEADSGAERTKELEKQRNIEREKRDLTKEQFDILIQTAEAVGDYEEARTFQIDSLRKQLVDMAEQTLTTKEAVDEFKESLADIEKGEDLDGALNKLKQMAPNASKLAEEFSKLSKKQKDFSQGLDRSKDHFDNVFGDRGLAGKLGIVNSQANKTVGSIAKLMSEVKMGRIPAEQLGVAMSEYLMDTFHYTKIASAVFSKIYDNTMKVLKAFDTAQASIAEATGQGREFNDTLYEVGRAGNLFGVSMDSAADAIKVMVAQTSAFTNLSEDVRTSVALDVAMMKELGISTAESAKTFQNFNQGLGITATESVKMQKELAMAGVEVGIGAEKITKDFNASLGTLMVYGRESINVFKGIAAAAKAAGVETSTLLGIASKFDTFAGAAEGAGKLNALLGTQLSTTEMLMATEDERIRMLVESVQAQGVAFQDMDRFTQKAIANSVGITDMAEANRIFGMSLKEYDENERKLKASADAQKKFEEAVAATVPVMEKFQRLGAEMITALQPTFEFLAEMADGITKFLREMDTETKNWAVGIVAALSAIAVIAPIFMAGGGLISGLAVIPAMIGAIGTAITGVITAISGAITATAGVGGGVLLALLAGGAVIGATMSAMSEASAKTAEAEAAAAKSKSESVKALASLGETSSGTLDNLDRIANADFSKAISGMKAIVGEASKLSNDLKVTSTIENLALVTAGQARDMSGNAIVASATNITTKVENIFSGMGMTLVLDDGTELKTYIRSVIDEA